MLIRLRKAAANPEFAAGAGAVVDVPTKLAKKFIKDGLAEAVEEKKPQTASAKPKRVAETRES